MNFESKIPNLLKPQWTKKSLLLWGELYKKHLDNLLEVILLQDHNKLNSNFQSWWPSFLPDMREVQIESKLYEYGLVAWEATIGFKGLGDFGKFCKHKRKYLFTDMNPLYFDDPGCKRT